MKYTDEQLEAMQAKHNRAIKRLKRDKHSLWKVFSTKTDNNVTKPYTETGGLKATHGGIKSKRRIKKPNLTNFINGIME